jgi:hypothetical protein
MKTNKLINYSFVFVTLLLVIQVKVLNFMWLKYLLMLLLLLYCGYFFFYRFLYEILTKKNKSWLNASLSGLILSWSAGLMALLQPVDNPQILLFLKVLAGVHYLFAYFLMHRSRDISSGLLNLLVALLLSALVFV